MEKTELLFQNDKGNAEITVYEVFNGIKLCYNSVHTDTFSFAESHSGNTIEINHCREGRMEQHMSNENFYLCPGDLSLTLGCQKSKDYTFPLRHYHGISIFIDTNIAPKCFSCFLQDVNVQPLQVAKHLCEDKECFVLRSEKYIEHIFSELYTVPESYKKGYFKIKILELLLVLSGISPCNNRIATVSLSKFNVELVKNVSEYLNTKTGEKTSVSELSHKFHVSQSHLQSMFKSVYGMPICSYIKLQKMQAAALDLIHTDRTVMDIASEYGYGNASKFSSAFYNTMGESPIRYRKMHSFKN